MSSSQSITYGCIACPGKDYSKFKFMWQRNLDAINSLPTEDSWPFLGKTIFSAPQQLTIYETYDRPIIHFGFTGKYFDEVWDEWVLKFERLLLRMYWEEAQVHYSVYSYHNHFQWQVEDPNRFKVDPPQTPTRWKFSGYRNVETENGIQVTPPVEIVNAWQTTSEVGDNALAMMASRYRSEPDATKRAKIVSTLWQSRRPVYDYVYDLYRDALMDPEFAVWNEAISALCATWSSRAIEILYATHAAEASLTSPDSDKLSNLAEAVRLIQEDDRSTGGNRDNWRTGAQAE